MVLGVFRSRKYRLILITTIRNNRIWFICTTSLQKFLFYSYLIFFLKTWLISQSFVKPKFVDLSLIKRENVNLGSMQTSTYLSRNLNCNANIHNHLVKHSAISSHDRIFTFYYHYLAILDRNSEHAFWPCRRPKALWS